MYKYRLKSCMLPSAACRAFFLALLLCVACVAESKAQSLTKQQAEALERQLLTQWRDSVRHAMADAYAQRAITHDAGTMRLHWTVYGDEPADGRSLYISLHGGGGAPAELNDSQWHNQWLLYQPAEGVYLCPRPPYNTWDLHFRPDLDAYYDDIIRMMQVFDHVNPDKVYLMGYSAGGDGVWRLAPRLADRWAAASMMAGHPGDVSLLNLRNLPFMIWCGANDAAYNRNHECARQMSRLDSLQHADVRGYVHANHLVAGKGHWMDRADTLAVGWMAQHRRQSYPDVLVWQQGDVPQPTFYWLQVEPDEMQRDRQVRIRRSGNTFTIDRCDYSRLTLLLNDALCRLDRPVIVRYAGRTLFEGKVRRSADVMRHTLYERGDPAYVFSARLTLTLTPPVSTAQVTTPPPTLTQWLAGQESPLDPWYQKYVDADGLPILSSAAVSDTALLQARHIVMRMLERIPEARDEMLRCHFRVAVAGGRENITDLPECRMMPVWWPDTDWDAHGRGYGATLQLPVMSIGEENLVRLPDVADRYYSESIMVHEFAHNVDFAMRRVSTAFRDSLLTAYREAKNAGLWDGTYAMTNAAEYFAEGAQAWFNTCRMRVPEPDGSGRFVLRTREQLEDYDPRLYAVCASVFPDEHLHGYHFGEAPELVSLR